MVHLRILYTQNNDANLSIEFINTQDKQGVNMNE